MRQLLKSMFRFSWGMSLFGVEQAGRLLAGNAERAEKAMGEVGRAAEEELGKGLGDLYRQGERAQHAMVDAMFGAAGAGGGGTGRPDPSSGKGSSGAASSGGSPPGGGGPGGGGPGAAPPAAPAAPPRPPAVPEPVGGPPRLGDLPATALVTVGSTVASGAGAVTLDFDHQVWSFPAQVARCLGWQYRQPLLEPPGIGNLPGLQALPVELPSFLQHTLLDEAFPPRRPFHDLCLPGLRLDEALERRPTEPWIDRRDALQTLLNLVVGGPAAAASPGGSLRPTVAEVAGTFRADGTVPLVVVALGDREVLDPVHDPAAPLPDPAAFGRHLRRLLAKLGDGPRVVANVFDPADTAAAVGLESAARTLKVPVAWLRSTYGLEEGDRLTVPGLFTVGCRLFGGPPEPLAAGDRVAAERTAELSRRVEEMDREVRSAAAEAGAAVLDLRGLARRWRREGVAVGGRRRTADYVGGLYTLNGYTPGGLAHALVANALLSLLEETWGASLPRPDLEAVAAADPVANHRPAEGPDLSAEALGRHGAVHVHPEASRTRGAAAPPAITPPSASVVGHLPPLSRPDPGSGGPLRLPPGREQVLPLSSRGSWFGDGILPVHAHADDERGIRWGSTGNRLFGGLALVDSPLSGELRIRFDEPQGGKVRFELDFGGGFTGADTTLVTPWIFRMPFRDNGVDPVPGQVSSGVLDLATGEVEEITVYASYRSRALMALVQVNPTFPRQPLSFPGQYGSWRARFEPRPDGLLDFTFYGSTFVPLGPDIRWPLPFRSGSGDLATVPAAGTAMHPHLRLSTRQPEVPAPERIPTLRPNSVHELVLFTHNSAFGDAFTLHAEELGGEAVGRSHLLGRLRVQVGEPAGGGVPVAMRLLPPGGFLARPEPTPLDAVFPGRLSTGALGHDETLRFPLRSYHLDAVSLIDDPFDLPVGRADLESGVVLEDLLHRAFIGQNLFFALVRVEPRTPGSSFYFRGPARFVPGPGGGLGFRFSGDVHIPYPEGFLFPAPDLASGFVIGPGSALDPYVWLRATEGGGAAGGTVRGEGDRLRASTGEIFSYRLEVADGRATFEYENHSQEGHFRMHHLVWLDLLAAADGGSPDTVTFAGLGTWSKDGHDFPHRLVTGQVCRAAAAPYVSIQVDGGRVSNVNLKPADEADARP